MRGAPTIAHVNDIAFVASTIAAEQRRRGVAAYVLDPAKPGASLPYPWKVLSAPLRLPIMAAAALRVRNADLVHVHYATHGLIGRLSGRPFVLHCHGSDVRGVTQRSPGGQALRRSMAGAALVLYSTPDLAADVRPYRDDAVFLPNPVDTVRFAPGSAPSRDVLLATRLEPVKGAEVALDVLDRLLGIRPRTTVTVVVDGSLSEAARTRLQGRVRFVSRRPHVEMPELFAEHRVSLGQFRLGILSQTELEAMASGSVVFVASRYPDALDEPPPVEGSDDAAATAAAIATLLDAPARLARLSSLSRAWVLRHHGVGTVVDRLEQLYGGITPGLPAPTD